MPLFARVARQLRALLVWKPPVEEEVDDELAFHVDMRTRELVASGMPPDAARAEALRRFGDMDDVNATCRAIGERRDREMRNAEWLAELRQDMVFAARQLRRNPGFTAVAVIALMLGIGATTAIFSVVNGVLLSALPFPSSNRIVRIYEGGVEPVSYLDYRDWREQSRSFEEMALFKGAIVNLEGERPERLNAVATTANFFNLFGIRSEIGRTFSVGDDAPGAPKVAVLTHELWQRRFGSDRSLVGKTIDLNGEAVTVIGVTEPASKFPDAAELWVPFVPGPLDLGPDARGSHNSRVVGRLKPGVTLAAATSDMSAVQKRLHTQYPDTNDGVLRMLTLHDDIVGDVRAPLLVLLGAVVLVLFIACTNVANLLLVRSSARQSEIALRTALGAGRLRLSRQLLTESVLLSMLGGALGVGAAALAVRGMKIAQPGNLPRVDAITLDWRVMLFALVVTVVTGVLFGLVPAIHATSPDLAGALRGGLRGSLSRAGSSRVRGALVIAEFALSLVLLAGAGLLIRSFYRLQLVNPGFVPDSVMTFDMTLPPAKYTTRESTLRPALAIEERLRAIPGVRSAALVFGLPMGEFTRSQTLGIVGRARTPESTPEAMIGATTFEFFATLRIPLIAGRLFDPSDREGTAPVALVGRAFAKKYFPNENPVGKRIQIDGLDTLASREIVGVVGDVHRRSLAQESEPTLYLPFAQLPDRYLTAVIRTAGSPRAIMSAARAAVHEVDPSLPTFAEKTMQERVESTIAAPRFYMLLLAGFAAVALVLASVGIYGVMSYAVSQVTRDLGIRVALGASEGQIVGLVVRQGMMLTIAGITLGLGGALALGRLMRGLLFATDSHDVPTLAAVTVLLAIVSLAACFVPARRAARVDPLTALRS